MGTAKTAGKTAHAKAKNLLIVESPAKAKTLKKFLGPSYTIEASMGHVRDLPKSELGIDLENDYEPKYITIRGKGELLAKLRKEAKNADKVYLATDPDREGEAISWHLFHALRLDADRTRRITFNEITKSAVTRSIKEARDIDMDLVNAQQARRALDRIVGYKISPLLWQKVKKGLSAGRVQSVALKIICDREEEIENFVPREYWTIDASFKGEKGGALSAKYYGKDGEKAELEGKPAVDQILQELESAEFTVPEVKRSTRVSRPLPPFTTSSLQQEASKAFGFAAAKTMLLAQQLYEGVDLLGEGTVGLVSYIRTDSVRISDEAYEETKAFITEAYGAEYAYDTKPVYKSRARAQDAHEAIRPTSVRRLPESLKESLSKDQLKIYALVWERFAACQMTAAVFETVSLRIEGNRHVFKASGSKLIFDGYKRVYAKDDEEKEDNALMADVVEGSQVKLRSIKPEQHFTQAPPRYTEANLVKTLEENGLGRPSTYAPTISTLTNRRYIVKENRVFYPTELGDIVNDIVKNSFEDIVNIDFTAKMEDELDRIEDGGISWKEILVDFYPSFKGKLEEAQRKVAEVTLKDEETDVVCKNCGRNMVIKFGKFGKFLACPGFPECRNTAPFFEDAGVSCPVCKGKALIKKSKKGRKYYGCENNPECGFISWQKPTGEKCPLCDGYQVVKGSGAKRRVCCSNQDCGFSRELTEAEEG